MWQNTLSRWGDFLRADLWLAGVIGKFCASHEGGTADRVICKIGTVSGCIPTFFWQLLLILIFAVNLRVLPVGGAYDYGESGNALNRAAASDPADCCDGAGASVVLRVFDSE